MLTCKQVSRALAQRDYEDLPLLKRVFLRAHVLLCFVCRRYHRSLIRFHTGVRKYRHGESTCERREVNDELSIRDDEREALKRVLRERLSASKRA